MCAPRAADASGITTRAGTQISERLRGSWNPIGMTPSTVYWFPLKERGLPTISGSLPKCRFQKPSLKRTTRAPPGRSSSGSSVRPSAGLTPSSGKRLPVIAKPGMRSGSSPWVKSRKKVA